MRGKGDEGIKARVAPSPHHPIALSDSTRRQRFRRLLLSWYRRNARDLPWRDTRDPYRIWVSEIMLQQTTVGAVRGYYERFIKSFPTVAALADAKEDTVLRLWEGLGYYRRARQLHKAARLIRDEHDGRFPSDPAAVRSLPGVGRYTCGAILSLAFGRREPIVEANTERLWCRLLGYKGDPRTAEGKRLLWRAAEEILPRESPGRFNLALMDLGSLVCRPREPRCDECPVATICVARRLGAQATIPRPAARPRVEEIREAALVVRRRDRILLLRGADGARWAGLWDFPRFRVESNGAASIDAELRSSLAQKAGIHATIGERIATFRHGVTRFKITLECREARFVSANGRATKDARWFRLAEVDGLPLNVTGRKLARLLRALVSAAAARPVGNGLRAVPMERRRSSFSPVVTV